MTTDEFLRALFPAGTPGHISLWNQPAKTSQHLTDITAAAALANTWCGMRRDVYFGVGTRREDLGPAKRGKKRDVLALPGLFVDIDLHAPQAHRSKEALPPDLAAASALLAAVGLEPTIIVHSGYGVHAYYLFDTPMVCAGAQREAQVYEAMLDALQGRVIAAAEARGWHVDHLADCTRVLRLPGTLNFKVPAQPVPVQVLSATDVRYNVNDLYEKLRTPAPSTTAVPMAPTAAVSPPAARAPAGIPMDELKARLGRVKDPTKNAMAQALLAGRSFADAERDRAMQVLCSLIAWIAPHNDPEPIVDLFRPVAAIWAAEPGAVLSCEAELAKFRDKLGRAQEAAREEEARVAAEDAGIKDILGFQEVVQAAEKAATYTTEELLAAADVAHASIEDLSKLWVVQVGEMFYVLTDVMGGQFRYSPPQRKQALRGLPDWLKRAPIEWRKWERKQLVPKTTDELLDEHCTVALAVEASLNLENSYLDIATCTFHEAACPPRRELKPVFNAGVQEWLEALGGPDKDKLLDWVATVTDLTVPSCALYLSGPPGTGKSLLANGLARIWTTGTPTEMAHVIGERFNEDLTKCPLVFADEALPTEWNGKQSSTALRALITQNRRTLSRKHLSNAALEGCIRVMMAANNDGMLAFNEDMTPDDIQAMAERFLHIDTTAAGQHLKARGPAHVEGWVTADIIAQHALWLKANRTVVRSGRLAVQGHVTRIHQAIATRGTVKGLVVEWLTGYLMRPSAGIPSLAPIRAGGGQFVVNTKVVGEYWEQYVNSAKVPTTGIISRVLKGLSTGREVRLGGVRCHEIDVAAVVQWALETGAGEPEAMMARVNAPIAVEEEKKAVDKAPPATVHDLKRIVEANQKHEQGESK